MELTKAELMILANMLANAQVAVKDAKPAEVLLEKLQQMIKESK